MSSSESGTTAWALSPTLSGLIDSQSSNSIIQALGTSENPDHIPVHVAASYFNDTMARAAKTFEFWPKGVSTFEQMEVREYSVGPGTGSYEVEGDLKETVWKLSDTEGSKLYGGMSDFIDPVTRKKKTKFHLVKAGRIGIAWEGEHQSGTPNFKPDDPKCLLLSKQQLATTSSQHLDTPSIQGYDIEFEQLPIDHSTDGKTSGCPSIPPENYPVDGSDDRPYTEDGRCFTILWRPAPKVEGVTIGQVDENLEDKDVIIREWSAYNVTKADGNVVPCKESIWYKDNGPVAYQRTIEGKDTGMF